MSRRLWFVIRMGGCSINRRFFNELFIIFLALLTFLTLSYLSPVILYRMAHKGQAPPEPKVGVIRMRTRPRREVDTGDKKPFTGHAPFVTDDIIDLIFNAKPCPGSPPIRLDSNLKDEDEQAVAFPDLITYTELINYHQSVNDSIEVDNKNESRKSRGGKARKHQPAYDALFIVCSNVKNAANREYFRQIYGNFSNTSPYKIKVVFLVGRPSDSGVFENVSKEAGHFSDIVMGNFLDHYDNLTYKTVMGYRWIHTHCRNMDLMLKLDDDVFVDVFKFFDVFQKLIKKQKRTINCFLNKTPRVHRVGKYQVSEKEFDGKMYPPFCSGFFVVPTPDIIDSYVSLYKDIRFFRLEDVFSYGMMRLAMIDVQLVHVDLVTVESREYINCVLRYKYKCKYVGAQVSCNMLPHLMERMAEYRRSMGLTGTQTSLEEE